MGGIGGWEARSGGEPAGEGEENCVRASERDGRELEERTVEPAPCEREEKDVF